MAYKINGTTVVDNSRNVCACCVTSCCITASDRMDAPSGTTAQRPSSPATGSIYFDTDEGALLSYDGSDWKKSGGGSDFAFNNAVSNSCDPYTVGHLYVCGCTCRGYKKCQNSSCSFSICALCSVLGLNNWCRCGHPFLPFPGGHFCCSCYNFHDCRINKVKFMSPGSLACLCTEVKSTPDITNYAGTASFSYTLFPNGSLCLLTSADHQHVCSFSASINKEVVITDKGAVSLGGTSTRSFGFLNCSCFTCHYVPPAGSIGFPIYAGRHLNGAAVNNTDGFVCSLFICGEMPFGSFQKCKYSLEILSDCIGAPDYKLCSAGVYKQYICCSLNPRELPCQCVPWCVYGFKSGVCSLSMSCCCFKCLARFTFIAKDVTADLTDPTSYCKVSACSTYGICEKTSPNVLYNSIGISRRFCCTTGPMRNLHDGQSCSRPFLSFDKRCLYIFYKTGCHCTHCATFCTRTCDSNATCFKCFFGPNSPALDVLDLCTGTMVCSIYWCDLYDCTKGNTNSNYCAAQTTVNCAWAGFFCGSLTPRSKDNISILGCNCAVRSCNCDDWLYLLSFRNCAPGKAPSSLLKFNESSLNFDLMLGDQDGLFDICYSHMQFLEMAVSGCCSSCANYTGLCAEAVAFLCDCLGAGNYCCGRGTYGFSKNLVGHCMMPAPLCATCCPPRIRSCDLIASPCGNFNGDLAYVNPYTDHLVCFTVLAGTCPNTSTCRINWIGVICYDLANNMCISEVNTIWPTSGEKCLHALKCGYDCYEAREGGDNINNTVTATCGPDSFIYPATYSNHAGTEGGVVVQFRGCQWYKTIQQTSTICSSCQYCPACPCGNGYLGYFGPCCKGLCVPGNTCGQSGCHSGLEGAGVYYTSTRVPFCKPLHCSTMFECAPLVKLWLELALGCNCLGVKAKSCSCNQTYACAEKCLRCCAEVRVAPGFVSKRDMTCAWTLNCTGVGVFASDGCQCNCVRCYSQFFDTSTAELHVMICCCCKVFYNYCPTPNCYGCVCQANKSFCGTLQELLECDWTQCLAFMNHCGCTICNTRCFCSKNCYSVEYFPSILDNINDTTLNCTSHSNAIRSPKPQLDNLVHNSYESWPTQNYSTGCTLIASNCEYGVRKATANTEKGTAGLAMEWFNEGYARICGV